MSALSTDRKPLVDYGVQIRFIKDLHDTGGGYPDKSKGNNSATPPSNKYGVAVRVQGISGQPYVVLKDGDKGDSYGVQLNTPTPSSGPPSPYNSLPKSKEPAEFPNPYGAAVNTTHSPVSPAEDDDGEIFGSPLKRPPGDGQAGTQGEEEGGTGKGGQVERSKLEPQLKGTPSVAEKKRDRTSNEEYNEAGLKPVKQNGFSGSLGRYSGKKQNTASLFKSFPKPPASTDEKPVPAIDTNSLAPINKLISKFNSGTPETAPQTRGRSGARQRLRFDERRRSRSLDARKDVQPEVSLPSPTANPYASVLSTSSNLLSSASGSLGRSPASVAKVTTQEAPKPSFKPPGKFVAKDTPLAVAKKPVRASDVELMSYLKEIPPRSLSQNTEVISAEEAQVKGPSENEGSLKRQIVFEATGSLKDVMTLQADLAEAAMLRQRQDDTLHQRERELTALKGALKEEVECHDREMEALREQYSQDMENLRRTMEQVTQSQEQIEKERERVNSSMLILEEELDSSRDQGEQWKTQLEATAQELESTREELLKSRQEKEEFEGELKDLQDSLLAMKKQMPASDDNSALAEELQCCHDDLKQARADLDKQKDELDTKSKALQAMKKANEEREAELLSEISRMKEQSQKDKADLEKALEKAKEPGRTVVDSGTNLELQEANTRLRERLARMTRLHSSAPRSAETEEAVEALEDENRSLKSQLEEAKRGATRLSKERDELNRRLEERDLERDALRRGKSDLEEQKRLLDRALEKINKEMEMMMGESRQSVATLQTQLDEYRDRSRKDLLEAQRNNKDRLAELQRAQSNLKAQQEEISRLKKELLVCSEERDSAQLERDLLNNRLKHLESELETEKSTHTDRTREIRGLEVDQLRSELMQERSARHDLEMDKSALERQVKELKSRMADMEGQIRPSAGITLLENKIQELEERLRSEEREKTSIQASQRRMERKLKELNATLDQERNQHVEQRDQLSLRVKALKRQVDESEGEVERLEGVRRKVLRDLEEQQELQEALQAKVTALENELKRKVQQTHRAALGSSTLSSEEEDGFYDTNITSILNEGNIQTTNC
ncbi:hypothetical protein PAMP_008192 [Pampus punctatissimus]